MIARKQSFNPEPRQEPRDWWARPVAGWSHGLLAITNMTTDIKVMIDLTADEILDAPPATEPSPVQWWKGDRK